MINRFALIAVIAIAPSAAFAQSTSAPATSPAPSSSMQNTTGDSMSSSAADGLRTADSAALAIRFANVKPADLMAKKLLGTPVYNKQKEKLGDIEDLVIEGGSNVTGLVVSVGGFLGIGESYVVLDPKTVVVNQENGKWQAFVDTSKDTLKNAPKFTYGKQKS